MEFVVTRVVDAPVEEVWQAWSEPEYVQQWWGPDGFTAPLARMDFREGGTSLVCMRSPEGQDLYNTWSYLSITPQRRIEFLSNFADETGARVSPGAIGLPPDIPEDVRHVVTFTPLDHGRTELTVTEYGYAPGPILEFSKSGQEQVFDKIVAVLTQP
jgi:uncharacterized protein YndB with AHSA1/START domain